MPNEAQLGTPLEARRKPWVQTSRDAHAAWGRLTMRAPSAGTLLHMLVQLMEHQNAVVVSQKTLSDLMGCSERTVRNAIKTLVDERWIAVRRLASTSSVMAYVVNDQVAWGEKRDLIGRLSNFSAQVVVAEADQTPEDLKPVELRRIPALYGVLNEPD